MPNTIDNVTVYTIADVALVVNRTPCRVRQICRSQGIGELLPSNIWLLTAEDVEKIRHIIQTDRRRKIFKNSR